MICPKCKVNVYDYYNYCYQCGVKLPDHPKGPAAGRPFESVLMVEGKNKAREKRRSRRRGGLYAGVAVALSILVLAVVMTVKS